MTLEKVESVASRLFFFGAFLLLVLSLIDWVAGRLGYRFVEAVRITQMLEMAVVLLTFVIAMLLREIREALTRKA